MRILKSFLLLALAFFAAGVVWGQAPASNLTLNPLPVPAPGAATARGLDDQEYSRARQKLLDSLSAPPSANPAQPAAAPASPAAGADASSLPLPPVDELPTQMRLLDDKQRLSPGDRVSFKVLEDKDESKPIVVTDSGELDVPYIGRLKVADKTCLQVAREAKVLLERDYYKRATVILGVDALSRTRGKVYLYGFVRTPGAQELPVDEVMTVGKILMRSGGFADFANKRKVKVTRKSGPDGRSVIYELDMIEVLEKGRQDQDIEVKPEDVIYVPQRLINI